MNIYPSTRVRPYVYICRHKDTGEFYIGYREKNVKLKRTSDIDLPVYQTSSKIVRASFSEFESTIIAEFFDSDSAYDFEQKLIFENWGNPLLLNKSCRHNSKTRFKAVNGEKCSRPGKLNGMFNKTHSVETAKKISDRAIGKAPAKDALTGEKLGKILLDDHRWLTGQIVGQVKGRKDSAETTLRKSLSCKGILKGPQKQTTCPHCGKSGGLSLIKRWHFNNCTFKK